jgi:hypothetical protein
MHMGPCSGASKGGAWGAQFGLKAENSKRGPPNHGLDRLLITTYCKAPFIIYLPAATGRPLQGALKILESDIWQIATKWGR